MWPWTLAATKEAANYLHSALDPRSVLGSHWAAEPPAGGTAGKAAAGGGTGQTVSHRQEKTQKKSASGKKIPPTSEGLGWEGLYVLTCTGSRILTVCIVDPKSLNILDLFNFSDLSPLNAFRFHFGIEPFWFDNRPMETNGNDVPTRMLSQNTRARNQTAHQDAMSKLTRNQNSSDPFGKSSGECP